MKIPDRQCDETTLGRLGAEVCELIAKGDYLELANRFGYALAFGKGGAEAIRSDVEGCLSENGFSLNLISPAQPEITVRYFKADNPTFVALVECRLSLADSPGTLLAELIVTAKDGEKHVTLEQVSRDI